ncbi:MAG: carboxypeptidase-like regulatory domain-containing protein [Flavobacteriaceae bacterium]
MKKFFSFLLFTACLSVSAQETGTIKGNVFDTFDQDETVMFASIWLKDTSEKTQTNLHGNFEFAHVPPGDYTVIIDYLGYESKEIQIVLKAHETLEITEGISPKKLALPPTDTALVEGL